MRLAEGTQYVGPAGTATQIIIKGRLPDPAWQATVACWFLNCPSQSPAWSHYQLAVIHLRDIDGAPPAGIRVPGATHEVFLAALDPSANPTPRDAGTWKMLHPLNVAEQIQLPDDAAAVELAELAAKSVAAGLLPAEPPLSGAVEPWRTSLLRTAAHLRGEEHAP